MGWEWCIRSAGLAHRPIKPQIERTHRTLDNLTGILDGWADLRSLQARLDAECEQYNFGCEEIPWYGRCISPVAIRSQLGETLG
jgi:hypothetical protein